MGRSNNTSSTHTYNTQPRPLASLRDPNSFDKPPKHRDTISGSSISRDADYTPLSRAEDAPGYNVSSREPESSSHKEVDSRPAGPFVADTTGLDTSRFPKPPVRSVTDVPTSPVATTGSPTSNFKPSLPPRLPPRQGTISPKTSDQNLSQNSSIKSTAERAGYLNQGAVGRLGRSGVSVPDFGIGSNSPDTAAKKSPTGLNVSGLQSKFNQLNTSSPTQSSALDSNSVWSSAKTGSSSASDMADTASAVNNIHKKHGNQIAVGVKAANDANQRYDIANKYSTLSSNSNSSTSGIGLGSVSGSQTQETGQNSDIGNRKPPPPPVPSKAALMSKLSRPPP